MKIFSLLALFTLLLAFPLRAADAASDFEQANKFYEQGRYADAVATYDRVIQSGTVSEAIYFNRGNAQFKMGQLGRAIASYRQAEQLSPRDPDLRANLQFARTQARGGMPYRAERWQRWVGTMTVNEWTLVTAGAVWLLFLLLALAQWRPALLRSLRMPLAFTGVAVVVLGVSLGSALNNTSFTQSAIVIAGEADVRNGPLDESASAFKVRDGVELTILDRKDNWLNVMDSAQRMGWLRDDQVILVHPVTTPKS